MIDSGLDLEETVILDDAVVKLAEHISVVVDQLEELTRNRAQVILANSKTRGNLRGGQKLINYHSLWIFKEFQNNKNRTLSLSQCEPT